MFMSSGDQMLKRVGFKIKEIGMEDTYYAILTPSQAALMLYGIPPPSPRETARLMREVFVKKEKILEDSFVKILEKNIQIRKELEHGTKKDLTGKEVDDLMTSAEKYLKRIKKLFAEIEALKEKESIVHLYESVVTIIRDILRMEGVEKVKDTEIVDIFESEVIHKGLIPEFIKFLIEYIQRKRGRELERTKIRVKHGNRYGEVILLDDTAFIVHDIDHEEKEISKAPITPDGGIGTPEKSSLEEMEKHLAKIEIPPKVFIKEKIFEDLKRVFGKDVEVLVNY